MALFRRIAPSPVISCSMSIAAARFGIGDSGDNALRSASVLLLSVSPSIHFKR
jgi:hypothetical protein